MPERRTAVALPQPRRPGSTYRIAVVCLGNICRSPIGEVVLSEKLRASGLDDRVEVVSAGTGSWHVGDPMDPRAAAVLVRNGYDASTHRATQFGPDWFADYDLILAMDGRNAADIARMLPDGPDSRVRMFRDFDPHASVTDRDVPDPWYGRDDGFDEVLAVVVRTATALVARLETVVAGG